MSHTGKRSRGASDGRSSKRTRSDRHIDLDGMESDDDGGGAGDLTHLGRAHGDTTFVGRAVPSSGMSLPESSLTGGVPGGRGAAAEAEYQAVRHILDMDGGDGGEAEVTDASRERVMSAVSISEIKNVLSTLTTNYAAPLPRSPADFFAEISKSLEIECPEGTCVTQQQVEDAWAFQCRLMDLLVARVTQHGSTDGINMEDQERLVRHILYLKRIVYARVVCLKAMAVAMAYGPEHSNWPMEVMFGESFMPTDEENKDATENYLVVEELLNIAEMHQAMRKGQEMYLPRRQADGSITHTMTHYDSVERWMWKQAAKTTRPKLWRMLTSKKGVHQHALSVLNRAHDPRMPELNVNYLCMSFQNGVLNIRTMEFMGHDNPRLAGKISFTYIDQEFPLYLCNITDPDDVATPNLDVIFNTQHFNGNVKDHDLKFEAVMTAMNWMAEETEVDPETEAALLAAARAHTRACHMAMRARQVGGDDPPDAVLLEGWVPPTCGLAAAKAAAQEVLDQHAAMVEHMSVINMELSTTANLTPEAKEMMHAARDEVNLAKEALFDAIDATHAHYLVPVYGARTKKVMVPHVGNVTEEEVDTIEVEDEHGVTRLMREVEMAVLPDRECKFCRALFTDENIRMWSAKDRTNRLGTYIDASGRPRSDDPACPKPWDHFPWRCKEAPGGTIRGFMARPLFPFDRAQDNMQATMGFLGDAGTGKSTLLEIMASMFDPEDVGVVAPNCEEKWWVGYIYDKLMAFFPELSEDMRVSRAAIQEIISNGRVGVALKNRDQKHLQWKRYFAGFAGNILPNEWTDTRKSLLRRLIIAMFKFVPENLDENLLERCMAELPCIIYRCLLDYHRMLRKTRVRDSSDRPQGLAALRNAWFLTNSCKVYATLNLLYGFLNDEAGLLEFGPTHYITYTGFWHLFNVFLRTTHGSRANRASDRSYYEGVLKEFGIKATSTTLSWPRDPDTAKYLSTKYLMGVGAKNLEFAE